jgi:hypothetical protein
MYTASPDCGGAPAALPSRGSPSRGRSLAPAPAPSLGRVPSRSPTRSPPVGTGSPPLRGRGARGRSRASRGRGSRNRGSDEVSRHRLDRWSRMLSASCYCSDRCLACCCSGRFFRRTNGVSKGELLLAVCFSGVGGYLSRRAQRTLARMWLAHCRHAGL